MATKKEKISFYGTGRRKKSIARVRLVNGNGNITVNNKPLDEFFGIETLKVIVKQPLVTTNSLDKFDVIAKVTGGGISEFNHLFSHILINLLLILLILQK